jgi:hypothetical protein
MGIGDVTEQFIPHEYCTVNIAFIFDNVPRYIIHVLNVVALNDLYERYSIVLGGAFFTPDFTTQYTKEWSLNGNETKTGVDNTMLIIDENM